MTERKMKILVGGFRVCLGLLLTFAATQITEVKKIVTAHACHCGVNVQGEASGAASRTNYFANHE